MGWNDRMPDIGQAARNIAEQAKAISYCDDHEEIWINNEDPDANRHAYAIGTNLWKEGGMACTREEFLDAIKECIEQGADECPRCAKIRDE